VVGGIVRRSRAQIQAYPLLRAEGREHRALLQELQRILDGEVEATE
jgi:hypothetical protein